MLLSHATDHSPFFLVHWRSIFNGFESSFAIQTAHKTKFTTRNKVDNSTSLSTLNDEVDRYQSYLPTIALISFCLYVDEAALQKVQKILSQSNYFAKFYNAIRCFLCDLFQMSIKCIVSRLKTSDRKLYDSVFHFEFCFPNLSFVKTNLDFLV